MKKSVAPASVPAFRRSRKQEFPPLRGGARQGRRAHWKTRESNPRESGFTLVEMMVSLVIFGMTTLLVVTGLGGARRAWERVDSRLQGVEATEGAETVLRRRMEGVWPSARYDGGVASVDFSGTASSLVFLAPPDDSLGPGALRRYSLQLAPDGRLILSSNNDLARDPSVLRRDEVLLHGAQSLTLAYFGAAGWQASWNRRPAPPRLIRVRVLFPPGDRRMWPDLIVHPKADVDADCNLHRDGDQCGGG